MKLTPEKQKHLAVAVIVAIGVAGALWYFGVQGLQKKRKNDTAELDRIQGETKKKEQEKQTELANRETAKIYQAYIKSLEDQMPGGGAEMWFEKNLRAIAKRYQLDLSNTGVQPIKALSDFKFKGQPYKLEGFRFEFKGELNQIGQFLQDIENNLPLMEVYELSITSGSGGGSGEGVYVHSVAMCVSMVIKP